MAKTRDCLLIFLLAATLLTGCTPRPEIRLFNHTDMEVTVVVGSSETACVMRPGAQCVFSYAATMRLIGESGRHSYRFPPRLAFEESPEFVTFERVSRRILKMQLEADWSVTILPAVATTVLTVPYQNQLVGFPLHPVE